MPADVSAPAALTASGEYVHSGVGPSSESLSAAGQPLAGAATLTASGGYTSSGFGPPGDSAAATGDTPLGGNGISVSDSFGVGDVFELGSSSILVELVSIELVDLLTFECGTTAISVEPVDAGLVIVGSVELGTTAVAVALVPIEAFGDSSFEFGSTSIIVEGTSLDQVAGGAGGQFEFGSADITLVGVPIEYVQTFEPFELGVAPIAITRVDADLYEIPPASLAPSPSRLDLAPTTREFEPPRYAVTFEQSMNGLSEAVLWGSKPGGAKMALGYKAIGDEWAEAWMKLYDDSREVLPLSLPDEVYNGLSTGLKNIYTLAKYGLQWFFAARPKIESVKEGFSSVDIDLEGRNARILSYSASGFASPDAPPPVGITDPGDPYVPLPDGDVTDIDEIGNVYFIVDANVEEVYNNPTFGNGADNRPGPSISAGSNFITSGTYTLIGQANTRNAYVAAWDVEGFEIWSQVFGLSGSDGVAVEPSLLSIANNGSIVLGLNETEPDRHTLLGITSNGTSAVVLASFAGLVAQTTTGTSSWANNYPSGYILCGVPVGNTSQIAITKISETFSIESAITLEFSSARSNFGCVADPNGSGKIFVWTNSDGIYCLNSSLSILWSSNPDIFVTSIAVNQSGDIVVTGRQTGFATWMPVTILSGSDGSQLLTRRISPANASPGIVGRNVTIRPEGDYIFTGSDSSVSENYGWLDCVAVSEDLEVDEEVEFSLRLSSYLPNEVTFHNMFASGNIAFTSTHFLLTHESVYGPLPDRTSSSAAYVVIKDENVQTTAPGTFGPDPKLLVAVEATVAGGTTTSFSASSVTRTVGGPVTSSTSRFAPTSDVLGRTTYPKTLLNP
jgi:hypothetical protein